MMSFAQSIATCFKKYVCFKGRARRSEYWWFWILPYAVSTGCTYLFKWKLDQRSELESQISGAVDSTCLSKQGILLLLVE